MANEENRSVNEVVLNGTTIISTREDSVAEDNLVMDETATNKAGEKIKGELDVASADETYNINDPVDDIADEDYIPFNDVSDSEMPKKKTLFSSFIEKLTKYFLPASSIGGKSQLKFNDSGVLDLQLNDIDASKTNNNVTSIHYPSTSNILDKEGRIIMRTEAIVNPDGRIGWKAYVNNFDTNGNRIAQRGLRFYEDKLGVLTFEVDDPRAFRKAIDNIDQLGKSLPTGTVIDDYHTDAYTGTYYFADDTTASGITTLPKAICGKLIVTNNGNGGFSQYYIPNHSVELWVRVWWSNAWSAWENVAREHTYDKGDEIPANANLNTYTTAGVYQCELSATARTMSNLPYTGDDRYAFKLIVMKDRKNANLIQWYIPYNANPTGVGSQLAYRSTDDGGTNWSEWAIMARENDISPSKIGLGYASATISGSAITATITGFKLRAGVIVAIKIEREMTTACTLNINNTGAKNIKYWNNQDPTYGKSLVYGGIFTFIYDGTYYRVLSFDRTPSVGVQDYVADTSGSILLDWGYDVNRAQLKHAIGLNKLRWNYYRNSAWRGDVTVADYDDIVHQYLGQTIPDNSNLNDYKTNGIYNISTNVSAQTISNVPYSKAGKLIVMRIAGNSYVKQFYLPVGMENYYRICYRCIVTSASSPTWTAWYGLAEQTVLSNGNVFLDIATKTTTAQDYHVGIKTAIYDSTTGKNFSYEILKAYQDHQANPVGLDLVFEGGGNTFIAGGDSGTALYPLKKGDGGENLYLLADGNIFLEANAQTVANRQGFRVDTNGAIIPVKAEALTDNFGAIGESSHKLANLWVYKINGSNVVTTDDTIISKKDITSPVTSLDDIPLNTAGTIVLDASISPTGFQITFAYICYGNNKGKTIEVTRYNHSAKDTEEFWKQSWGDTTGWTGWMPLSRQGTYVGTCATAANERAKVATVDADFSLKKGVRVAIKFSNTNTYSSSTSNPITLNVNSTGAKNIWYNNTHSGAGNTGTYTRIYGVANRYVFYIYDGTYWVWDSYSCDDNSTNFLRNDTSSTLTASAPQLRLKNSDINAQASDNGITTTKYSEYQTRDKNDLILSDYFTEISNYGKICIFMQVRNYNGSTSAVGMGNFGFRMDKSGNVTYQVDAANNFNAATGFGYGTCSTAADQQIKVVTLANFVLSVGATVNVRFTNTNSFNSQTSTPIQLNVNNTGAKNIWYGGTHSGAGNTGTNTRIYGEANRVFTYMYDGTYWVWLNCGYEADTTDLRNLGFGYGTCDTAEATTAKVVSFGSYNLKTGGYVTVWFKYNVPASATMNINSKGAKNIYYRGSAITANQIKAGDRATFIYDGTNYQLIGVDRDNYLKINYSYSDSTGTPSSSYVTEKVSELKLPEFKYVVEGDVVCLSVALWWDSATTYPSGATKLFKLNYAPRQLMFWLSDKSNVKGYINTDGTFYIRGNTINAGTYAYVQITFLKSGA